MPCSYYLYMIIMIMSIFHRPDLRGLADLGLYILIDDCVYISIVNVEPYPNPPPSSTGGVLVVLWLTYWIVKS